jgi:long-chain fatty acid transport protein
VKSIANPSTNMAQLGADNGPGFGWKDVDVWKLGVEYKYSQPLTLRAGYNHTDNPIQSRDVTFNILAPAVIKDHATLGFTYALASGDELTMAYMHAFKNDVTGTSILPFGGTEKIQMYENSLGFTYSWKM